jgi:hypothetical protein
MEMKVETYDMLETIENQACGIDDQSKELIKELNLEGQESLLNDSGERQPYQILSEQQGFICNTLFPVFTRLDRYSIGPIPYRVLKEAKVAKDHFKYLYVLHEAPLVIKDPVLIGSKSELYDWNKARNRYEGCSLIARWGEALESWEDMYGKAVKVFFKEQSEALTAIRYDIEKAIEMMKSNIMPTNKSFNIYNLKKTLPFASDDV